MHLFNKFLFAALFCTAFAGCAGSHPSDMPGEVPFPAPLACDAPEGMIAIVAGDVSDLRMRVGDAASVIHYAVCNRTDRAVGIDRILVTETRLDRPITGDGPLVVPVVGFETDADSGVLYFDVHIDDMGVTMFFVGDARLIPSGQTRQLMLMGFPMDETGEAEFTMGLSDGTFASAGSFRSVDLSEVIGNLSISRRVIVDP